MTATEFRRIESRPIDWFRFDPDQPRKAFDEDDLRALGASLVKRQWYAVVARPDGLLLDGERRVRAARAAGKESLDVVIVGGEVTPAEAAEMQLVTAFHREDLTPVEKAAGFRRWHAENPGKTTRELAARLDKDPSLVSKYLSLFAAAPAVREAAAAGRGGPTQWYALGPLPAGEQEEATRRHRAGLSRRWVPGGHDAYPSMLARISSASGSPIASSSAAALAASPACRRVSPYSSSAK